MTVTNHVPLFPNKRDMLGGLRGNFFETGVRIPKKDEWPVWQALQPQSSHKVRQSFRGFLILDRHRQRLGLADDHHQLFPTGDTGIE